MLQAQWTSDGIGAVEVAPGPLEPGWVRLQVTVCGICGSDLHYYSGKLPMPVGDVPGHEMVGTILEGGKGLADCLYAVEPNIPCLECQQCAAGNQHLCQRARFIGIASPGGLARSIDVPTYTLHPVKTSIPPLTASLAEPLACSYRAVQLARLQIESRVLVLGAGTIGLLAGLLARERAAEVAITARPPHQQEAARRLGLLPLDEDGAEDWAGDREPDVVIETVGGAANTIHQAIEACQPGGRIVIVGIFTQPPTVNALALVIKEVEMVGSSLYGLGRHGREFRSTVELIPRYRGEMEALLTHQFPLASVAEAFACAADKSSGAIKVTVITG